jgi:DNA-binding transcriptional LysR family regulator
MLSSKQIEVFYNIYRYKSMTAAASELKVSQPSISKTLGVIEKNLGFKLFIRKGKFLDPTDEAKELFEHASLVNSQLKNFNYVANSFKSRSLDFINIGTTPSLAESIVPEIITKYKKINPAIRFNIINLNSIDLIEDRYKPDIDLTICFNAPNTQKEKRITLLSGNHVVASPYIYNLNKKVDIFDLIKHPHIEITNLLTLGDSNVNMKEYLITNHIGFNYVARTDSNSAALSLVSKAIGIAIIDDTSSKLANNNIRISELNQKFSYEVNLVPKKEVLSIDCASFIEYVSNQTF